MSNIHTAHHPQRDATTGRDPIIESYIERSVDFLVARWRGRPLNEAVILDVGCDTGYALEYLRTAYQCPKYNLIGVDAQTANNPFDLEIRNLDMADARAMAKISAPHTVHIAILNHSLEHVENPHAVLRALDGLLAEQAQIFIGLPHALYPWALWDGHASIWTPAWTETFMARHGWRPTGDSVERTFRPDHLEFWNVYQRHDNLHS